MREAEKKTEHKMQQRMAVQKLKEKKTSQRNQEWKKAAEKVFGDAGIVEAAAVGAGEAETLERLDDDEEEDEDDEAFHGAKSSRPNCEAGDIHD